MKNENMDRFRRRQDSTMHFDLRHWFTGSNPDDRLLGAVNRAPATDNLDTSSSRRPSGLFATPPR